MAETPGLPTEMEARVARVLAGLLRGSAADGNCGARLTAGDAVAGARAVVRCMRDPTPDMLQAGLVTRVVGRQSAAGLLWMSMIDAASPGGSR